jgi:protein-S-isoprenylcysteine O-methyltransferase Ste14
MTIPLVFTWPIGVVFWLVSIWFYIPEMRLLRGPSGWKAKSSQDSGSITLIMVGGQLGSLAAFLTAFFCPSATIVQDRIAVYLLGIILLIAAGILRRHCFRMLGENFTGVVLVKENQPIVERGAYKWIRHPSYSAAYLLYLALGLALTNWVSIILLVVTAMIMYSYRISVEERALIETLGEPYMAYQRRTKKLIPFLY